MTPERDNATAMFPAEGLTPGVYSANAPGALVDMLGYHSATVLLHVGIGGIAFSPANKIELVLSHGNAADGSDLVLVTDDDILPDAMLSPPSVSNGIVRALVAAHPAADVQKIGYVGGKRYLKLVASYSGVHGSGTPIAATVARGRASLRGVA